ncbi:MAG: cytochrome P450 [Acidimicrobiia bacterium]
MPLRPGDLNLADPVAMHEFGVPPHAYLAVLRREAPVWWNPAPPPPVDRVQLVYKGFWVLSKHADVQRASADPEHFACGIAGPLFIDPDLTPVAKSAVLRSHMMGMDPPRHTQYRRIVQPGFTPRAVAQLEPTIRAKARDVVAQLAERDRAEFVFDVAAELPMILLCELMGVPQDRRAEYFRLGNGLAGFESRDFDPDGQAKLWRFLDEVIADADPASDTTLIGKYLHASVDGRAMSRNEVNSFFNVLSIAGHETTRNTTAHFVRLMDEHPDQKSLLLEDLDARLPNAIEEVLRFSPPVMQFCRIAPVDVEVRGATIHAGDKVMLSYVSANRDDEVFRDPDTFDILRPDATSHLAFGSGPHFCIGAAFARMQLRCLLGELYRQVPGISLAGPAEQLESVWFNALTSMPVETCPVAAH